MNSVTVDVIGPLCPLPLPWESFSGGEAGHQASAVYTCLNVTRQKDYLCNVHSAQERKWTSVSYEIQASIKLVNTTRLTAKVSWHCFIYMSYQGPWPMRDNDMYVTSFLLAKG